MRCKICNKKINWLVTFVCNNFGLCDTCEIARVRLENEKIRAEDKKEELKEERAINRSKKLIKEYGGLE